MSSHDHWARLVHDANVPALLMVVFQVTGDGRWLEPPYAPTRAPGTEEHDDGGLPSSVQQEIRAAAATCLARLARGGAPAIATPGTATLATMFSVCMGEDVPVEYAALMLAERADILAGRPAATLDAPPVDPSSAGDSTVLVIGAGVSGLTLSHHLNRAGVDHVLVERAADVGGCWLDNRYPGCGVDTPSHLYSHSFYQYDWSRYFAQRDEVLGYLSQLADDLAIRPRVHFGQEVTSLDWDEPAKRWRVELRRADGAVTHRTARIVVTAVGQLNVPKVPTIPGAETFPGPMFHSARWPEGLDLAGQRVAVVGTGASAMQLVPRLADACASVVVFQRSPQWIAPNTVYFHEISATKRELLQTAPLYRFWYRARLAWTFNDKVHPTLRRDSRWAHPERSVNEVNDGHRRAFERYLRAQLAGRDDLIEKSLPDYPPFGKRMLLDNGWYAAIRRPTVELIAGSAASIAGSAVTSSGGEVRDVDAVILATGFQALRFLHPIRVRGAGAVDLRDLWGDDDGRAHLGLTMPGFPNLFFMYGPNTNLGHGGGWMQMAEFQAHYIASAARALLDAGATAMECRPGVELAYTARVNDLHEKLIWTHPGMDNWYRNAAGRVVANSPWRVVDYWSLTREFDGADYEWTQ